MHLKNYNIVGFLKKNSFFDDSPHKKLSSSLSKQKQIKATHHSKQKNHQKFIMQDKINQQRQFLFRSRAHRFQNLQSKDQIQNFSSTPQKFSRRNFKNDQIFSSQQRFTQKSIKKSIDKMEQGFFSTKKKQKTEYYDAEQYFSVNGSKVRFLASKKQANDCLLQLSKTVQNQINNIDFRIAEFEKILYKKIDQKIKQMRKKLFQAIDQLLIVAHNQTISQLRSSQNKYKQNMIQVKIKLLENQQYITQMQKQMQINWKKVTAQLLSQRLQKNVQKLIEKSIHMKIQFIQDKTSINFDSNLNYLRESLSLIIENYLKQNIFPTFLKNK